MSIRSFGTAIAVLGLLSTSVAFAAKAAKTADATAAPAVMDACGVRKLTKKFDKPMGAAQDAFSAKKWDEVLAKVAEANAVPVEKTEFDQFWMHEFTGVAYTNQKKYAEASRELEAALISPCMAETDKLARTKLLMQINYQIKDYAKVIDYGNKVLATNPDPEVGIYVGNAYYIKDDYPNTRKVLTSTIATLEGSGKTPEEQTYRILQGACLNMKDNVCVVEQFEKLVLHYPKPSYWQDLTNSMLRVSSSDKQLLNIMRLVEGVDVLVEGGQYIEMAQLAIAQGLPGEAQGVIEKGLQKGIFTNPQEKERANRLLAEAKQGATLDKSTLANQDAAARAKTTGDSDVKLGAAYLSYGQTDKAIDALQRGIAKGGVKNPDEAGLLLGIAQLRANNKPEAIKAFETVKQDPTMTRIAKMWLLNTGRQAPTG